MLSDMHVYYSALIQLMLQYINEVSSVQKSVQKTGTTTDNGDGKQ